MNGYVALYNGKRAEVWADTLLDAKRKALKIFNLPASKAWMVDVVLAQKGQETVVHSPAEV